MDCTSTPSLTHSRIITKQHCIMIVWETVCNSHDNRAGDAQYLGNHTLLISLALPEECLELMRTWQHQ